MEEQEKKETLAKLYSLRAGLSVLSDGNQKAAQAEYDARKKITSFGNRYTFYNERLGDSWKISPVHNTDQMINKARILISRERDTVLAELSATQRKEEVREKIYNDEVDKAKSEQKGSRIMGPILMLIGIAIAIAILATTLPTWSTSDGGEKFGAIAAVFVFGGGPFAAGLFVFIRAMTGSRPNKAESIKIEHREYSHSEISALKNHLDRVDAEEIIPVLQKGLEEYKREYLEKIDSIQASSNALYRLLQKEFSPLLDERDWQHLDLIIFYFETGRADSMKEALSMVDRELQTNRIVEAIDMAAREICSSIERQTEVLQRTMVACCAHLSEQLSSIETQLAVQNAQLSGLLDAAHMNNALLRHANDSSKQLYEDATRVCHLIEAREIRRIS